MMVMDICGVMEMGMVTVIPSGIIRGKEECSLHPTSEKNVKDIVRVTNIRTIIK